MRRAYDEQDDVRSAVEGFPRRGRADPARTVSGMTARRLPVLLLAFAALVASGCSQPAGTGDHKRNTTPPPAPGAIVYSVHAYGVLAGYEYGALVDDDGVTILTETDHRVVRAVSQDGRLMVLGDYHDRGGGLFARWRARAGGLRTHGLTADPSGPVAVCSARSAVYADGVRLMHWVVGAPAHRAIPGFAEPRVLACTPSGKIAALARDGTLMLGDATSGLRATAPGRYTDVALSPLGRLAACSAGGEERGGLVLLDATGTPSRRLAQIGSGCALSWAPDGRHVAATSDTGRLIVACSCGERARVIAASQAWGNPTWSPDGRAIAYGNVFELGAVGYPSNHRVTVRNEEASVVAWLAPRASRRARRLSDV